MSMSEGPHPSQNPTPHPTPPPSATAVASGWYPDPAGSGGVRFWDGARWTVDVAMPHGAVAPTPAAGWFVPTTTVGRIATAAAAGVAALQVGVAVASAAVVGAERERGALAADDGVVLLRDDLVGLAVLALVAGYVTGCLWLRRARTNAEVLTPGAPHKLSRSWVWFAWFVPVVSLWFPYLLVRDVARAARGADRSPLVGWWWGLFLAFLLTFNVSDTSTLEAEQAAAAETVLAVVAIVAAAAWGLVIRDVGRAQRAQAVARGVIG
ncbi:DUF4328 domain-containing protein [Nocardioides sp.]|uniref:DUF4328 domain-containing protein n=1 Tax=Nocardioides sp. TaxID=35761 RepID=UPI00351491ED